LKIASVAGTIFNVIECVTNGHPVWFNAYEIPPEDGTSNYEVHSEVTTFLTGAQYLRLDVAVGAGLTFFISLDGDGKYLVGLFAVKKIEKQLTSMNTFISVGTKSEKVEVYKNLEGASFEFLLM